MNKDETTKNDLEQHIERFPSKFDTTCIAYDLRQEKVSVKMYSDVRDRLWQPLHSSRKEIMDLKMVIKETIEELEKVFELEGV